MDLKEHPDTVGGAMLTGMREAVRILSMLRGDREEIASAAAAARDTSTAKKRHKVRSSSLGEFQGVMAPASSGWEMKSRTEY